MGKVEKPAAAVPDESTEIRQLTPHQLALIEAQSTLIEDPETRQALKELMQLSMQQPR